MKQVIENYRIISTNHFVTTVCEGRRNSERFCFIIGAGASVSSGIPMGVTLEAEWMEEMEKSPGFSEVREFAETLRKAGRLEHDFSEIEQAWEAAKKSKQALPSEYYFDIYSEICEKNGVLNPTDKKEILKIGKKGLEYEILFTNHERKYVTIESGWSVFDIINRFDF